MILFRFIWNLLIKISLYCFYYIFYKICLICRTRLEHDGFCRDCFADLYIFDKNYVCNQCGQCFNYKIDHCYNCIINPPAYDICRSLFLYDSNIKPVVNNFKYTHSVRIGTIFARMFYYRNYDIIYKSHFIVPVPMHIIKLFVRGYNPPAVFAHLISELSGVKLINNFFIKSKITKEQKKLSKIERENNLNGSIHINPKYINIIKNKNFLIIDDIKTTGSTLTYCSKILRKFNPNKIFVASIAAVHKI